MRKIFGLILLLLFVISSTIFFLLLNFKIGLFNADRLKFYLKESNAYKIAAANLRESIVQKSDFSLNEGAFLETLTEAVSPELLAQFAESVIDRAFVFWQNPSQQFSLPTAQIGLEITQSLKDKSGFPPEFIEAGFSANPQLKYLQNDYVLNVSPVIQKTLYWSRQMILLFGLLAFVFLLLLFFLCGSSASPRFVWLGSAILILGLEFLLLTFGAALLLPAEFQDIMAQFNIISPKIFVGAEKLFALVLNNQKAYLIAETIGALALGLFLIFFGRAVREEKLSLLSDQISK